MTSWVDTSCIMSVFLALIILSNYRVTAMIRIFAVQSFVLSLLPFFLHASSISGRDIFIVLVTMVLKAALVPSILFWAIRHVSMRSEIKPIIGFRVIHYPGGHFDRRGVLGFFIFKIAWRQACL